MLPSNTRLLVASVVLGLSVCLLSPAPVSAGSPSFTLFTSVNDGWGSTNTSLNNPGPPLLVYQADNVTLALNGTDSGRNHNWFIDYDNDSRDDANEPNSPTFQDTAISWNFTASVNGTYFYRDRFNPTNAGQIEVRAGSPPPGGIDNSVLIAIGAVVAFVAVVALLFWLMRKKPASKPKPENK